MSTDYNKKRYLQLLDQRSIGDNSNNDELSRYSCMLTNQLDWEIRDQYLSLMEKFLNGNISMPEFFAELRIKNYAIIDAVTFLEKHRILLSFDKKASKFGELLEDVIDELEGDISYTGDEFKNFIQQNRAFGELGHPDGPTVNLERVSHMITSLKPDGKNFIGAAKIMDTPMGKIVKNLMDEGAKLGVSSRGMGSLRQKGGANVVSDDFYLATAADIVADPSAPNAFVEGIMEGKEWVWNNGALVEAHVADLKKKFDVKKHQRQVNLEALEFAKFLEKL